MSAGARDRTGDRRDSGIGALPVPELSGCRCDDLLSLAPPSPPQVRPRHPGTATLEGVYFAREERASYAGEWLH